MVESVTRRCIDALSLYYRGKTWWVRHSAATVQVEKRRSDFYRSIWEEAAASVDATVSHPGGSLLEIRGDGLYVRVSDNVTSLDDAVTLRVAGDKPLVHLLLSERGIPVPRHLVCGADDLAKAWGFVAALGGPSVVKPARNTGKGNGVTAGITKKRDLARAMALSAVYGGETIVEEQVVGDNYRLLFFDGELLDAVCRVPPTVRGDGTSSLKELIRRENRDRMREGINASQTLLPVDWELRQVLRERGYSLDSVPPDGELVRVKTVVSDNRRDENVDAMARLRPEIVEAAAAAARAVGARLAAVDLITSDPQAPLTRSGGAIIEVNTTPGFYFHYMKRPAGAPVARLILERLTGNAR